ncbi:hypothetical protein ES705_35371 [subsurface metagenome]
MLLLLSNRLFYLNATTRAELGRPAQPGTTIRTGEVNSHFKVLNGYRALLKVDIPDGDPQDLRNAAAKSEGQPNQELVAKVLTGFL